MFENMVEYKQYRSLIKAELKSAIGKWGYYDGIYSKWLDKR